MTKKTTITSMDEYWWCENIYQIKALCVAWSRKYDSVERDLERSRLTQLLNLNNVYYFKFGCTFQHSTATKINSSLHLQILWHKHGWFIYTVTGVKIPFPVFFTLYFVSLLPHGHIQYTHACRVCACSHVCSCAAQRSLNPAHCEELRV